MDRSYAFLDVADGALYSVYVHSGPGVDELYASVGEFRAEGRDSPFIVCVQDRCIDATAGVEREVSAQGLSQRGRVSSVDVGGEQMLQWLCDGEDKAESVGHEDVSEELLWGCISCEFLMAWEWCGCAGDSPSL